MSSNGKLFCNASRVDSLKEAISKNIDVVIFDDGLQERSIEYDISFVCFNIQNWIGNGLCIPAGPLREKLKNIKKYDAIFLNGNGEETIEIENVIKNIKPNIEIFKSKYVPMNLEEINIKQNYLAFSGIGNPQSFLKTLMDNNFKILKSINFPDHYDYTNKDVKEIKKAAKDLGAKIITTEKDYNRLDKNESDNIEYLKVELKPFNEEKLINFLNQKL